MEKKDKALLFVFIAMIILSGIVIKSLSSIATLSKYNYDTLENLNISGSNTTNYISSVQFPYFNVIGGQLNLNTSSINSSVVNNYYGSSNTTYYNVSTVQTVKGTSTTSNLTLLKIYDSKTWNITEASGSEPIDFRLNFTGVTNFNKILLRERYLGGSGHEIVLYIWDYTASNWESYMIITDQAALVITEIPVLDSLMHISAGKVQVRFLHLDNGIPSHKLYLDLIQLVNSDGSLINNLEHDSLSGRDSICTNHPEVCLKYYNKTYLYNKTQIDTTFSKYDNYTKTRLNDTNLKLRINNLNSTLLTKYYNITQDATQDANLLKTIPSRQALMYDELLYWAIVRSPDMTCAALGSGTAAVAVPKDRRIGRVSFLDSTTANGGYICRTDVANLMYFTGYERLTFGFDMPNTANVLNTTIIMGFGDATAAGEPTDACYLYGGNRQLQGRCKNNAGPTKTSTNLTLKQNGNYLADISMNQGVTSALFQVYNYTSCTNYFEVQSGLFSSCTLLWSNTVGANIPNTVARAFGVEFYATQSSINAGSILINWDFIKLEK